MARTSEPMYERAYLIGGSLRDLVFLRDCRRRRLSSYDRSGGNDDRLHLKPGRTAVLADIAGSGCITHIWVTIACDEKHYLRKLVLRMFWDGESSPSVEAPIGDFFGMGHALTKSFWSLPLTMSPQDGRGFNCFFPMPFRDGARIEVASECHTETALVYYYVDYEEYSDGPETGASRGGAGADVGSGVGIGTDAASAAERMARFHAQWRRQNPCDGIPEAGMTNEEFQFGGRNVTGEGNYVILEAEGRGQYLGCNLNIHNLRAATSELNWYGEGDDMIFIDGEPFPPSLHGTGTEDYFNCAWCPTQEYSSPYHGIILGGGPNWSGKISLYRYHIADPVQFSRSIRVTIEHGHNNHRSDDYSSTAYWMQFEPHKPFGPLSPVEARLPRE